MNRDAAMPPLSASVPPLRFQPAHSTPFARELRQAAQALLDTHADHRWADIGIAAKALLLAVLLGGAYAAVLGARTVGQLLLAFVACQALAMTLAMNVLHDAAHEALFRRPGWNRLARWLCSLPVGIDSDFWTVRHVQFHHTWANVDGHDLDIEPNPFLRQTPYHPWAPQYRHQHRYWPLIAALSLPYLAWYSDWLDRLGLSKVGRPAHLQNASAWGVFVLTKVAHISLMLALPTWLAVQHGAPWGVGTVIACYLGGQLLASCFLVAMILGTHWAEVQFYRAPPTTAPTAAMATLPHTWYEHSFYTACDWQPRPAWLGYWLGGLNLHLTHHLFPTWNHRHYPALAAVVQTLAARHGLPYRCMGYGELLAAQQRFLRDMGQPRLPPQR